MATNPAFASTPNVGHALLGAVETNLQVPTTASTVLTAGASGTLISSIVIEATTTSLTPTTVAGLVYIYIYDGATHHLFDVIVVTAITGSAALGGYRSRTAYTDLVLKNGESLRASQSNASNASILKIHAIGADY